jgi:hypothetical protein
VQTPSTKEKQIFTLISSTPNKAIGSSPFTAAIAAVRQGDSWAVFF